MIKPTVGRVVLLRRPHDAIDPSQPEAALVTYVHNDREINIGAFLQSGHVFHLQHVQLLQDEDVAPTDGTPYCEWMPYQKGQAAKAEQAEAALKSVTGS